MSDLLLGLTLGAAAGITPGPLFTLVVTVSLRRGFGAGARTALAPLLSDLPVVVIALAALAALPGVVVRGLGLVGGLYLIWLGIRTVSEARNPADDGGSAVRDLRRGVVVNLLSPHPWLFWFSVGAPLTLGAWQRAPVRAVAFVGAFYALLVGSKMVAAAVVASGRRLLDTTWHIRLAQVGGVAIAAMGVVLITEYLR